MKKCILLCSASVILTGCSTVKRFTYEKEIHTATELKNGGLQNMVNYEIEKGSLTNEQFEAIKPGAVWILNKIIERAQRKIKELDDE